MQLTIIGQCIHKVLLLFHWKFKRCSVCGEIMHWYFFILPALVVRWCWFRSKVPKFLMRFFFNFSIELYFVENNCFCNVLKSLPGTWHLLLSWNRTRSSWNNRSNKVFEFNTLVESNTPDNKPNFERSLCNPFPSCIGNGLIIDVNNR